MSSTRCPTTPDHLREMAEMLRDVPGGIGEVIETLESMATWLGEQPLPYCPFGPGDHIGWISRAGLRSLRAGNSPTIHAKHSVKFDMPIFLGRIEDLSKAAPAAALDGVDEKLSRELLSGAKQELETYVSRFTAEYHELSALLTQMASNDLNIFERSNMRGHITGSGIVFDWQARKVMVVDHLNLGRMLQPGGHHERRETMVMTAKREVAQETGLQQFHRMVADGYGDIPVDIETHAIPANPAKREGAHQHHDFAYLFLGDSEAPLQHQSAEVRAAKWIALEDFAALPGKRFSRIAAKLRALCQRYSSVPNRA